MLEFMVSSLCQRWLVVATDATFKATLFLLLCGAVAFGVRRHAALRHFVGVVAFVGLLLLPLLSINLPRWHMTLPLPAMEVAAAEVVPVTSSAAPQVAPQAQVAEVKTAVSVPEAPRAVDRTQNRAKMLLACWLLGAAFFLSRLTSGQRAVRRLEAASQVVPEGTALATLCSELAPQMKVGRPVTLRQSGSALLQMPMTWGWRRPVVLLPCDAHDWPLDQARSVLLHELGHVRRADWATQQFAFLVCALYWFHPLVWLAAAGLRAQGERATDDSVLAAGVKPSTYCAHLLKLAQSVNVLKGHRNASCYAVPMARSAAISGRLSALLDERRRRGLTRPTVVAVVGLAGLVLALLAALDTRAKSQPQSAESLPPIPEVKLPVPPQPDPVKVAQAQELVRKCRAAYAELESYQGTTTTSNVTLFDGKETPSRMATADITWAQPNLANISGQDTSGNAYFVVGNAEGSWSKRPLRNQGEWQKIVSVADGTRTLAGVANKAPTTIPGLLLEAPSKPKSDRTFRYSEWATVEKEEAIDGHPCFKVTAVAPEETVSWWIDKNSFLMRRLARSYSEVQSARMLANTEKRIRDFHAKYPGRGDSDELQRVAIQSRMRFVSSTEDYTIKAVNAPIAPETFRDPTQEQAR